MRRLRLAASLLVLAACGGDDSAASSNPDTSGSDASLGAPDGASAGDAAADAAHEAGPPPCGESAWTTYGKDARRTFATDGCVTAPLSVKWHYAPAPPNGRTFEQAFRAVAQKDAVFLAWMASAPPYTGTTAADRIDTTGQRVWTFDSGTDTSFGNWPSIGATTLAVNDDGLYLLGLGDGKVVHSTGVDWWGQTIPNGAGFFVVNALQADGPGIFVGAVDDTAKTVWQQNLHQMCGKGWGDVMGGIAADGGVLFYAPLYQTGTGGDPGFPSGVFAFDGAAGTPKWSMTTTKPKSAVSAGDGRVYLVEDPSTIVARSQADGAVVWSKPLAPAQIGGQAPVLANGLAIVATTQGLVAVHASDGTPAWTAPKVSAAQIPFAGAIGNGCGGTVATGGAFATSMAASLASGTLVVTANDGVHLVALATGADMIAYAPDGGAFGLHDPVIVGKTVYVIDSTGVLALAAP